MKLDVALVHRLDASAARQRLVRSMVDLCWRLGMDVVAEGVETGPELEIARELGCRFAKGNFIGPPSELFAAGRLPNVARNGFGTLPHASAARLSSATCARQQSFRCARFGSVEPYAASGAPRSG